MLPDAKPHILDNQISEEKEFYFLKIRQLKSQRWVDKNSAFESLRIVNNHTVMEDLIKYALNETDFGIQYTFSKVVQKWLKRRKFLDTSLSLVFFFNLSSSKSIDVKTYANDQLEWFIFRSRCPTSFIIETLRRSWTKINHNGKTKFTNLVYIHKLQNLIPSIIENYKGDDLSLKITTTKAIFKTSDPRAKRYLIKELKKENLDENYCVLLINTLAEIGSFFDFYFITPFLKSDIITVKVAAIHCFTKLLGHYSIKRLEEIYFNLLDVEQSPFDESEIIKVKIEILNRLSRTHHKKSIESLIKIYRVESDHDRKKKIIRTFIDVKCEEKIPLLISFFNEQNPTTQYEIIPVFGEIQHPLVYEFLLDFILKKENDLFILTAMDYISNFDRPGTLPHLEYFIEQRHPLLSSYALSSILNHNSINKIEYIEQHLKEYSENHSSELTIIILRALSSIKITGINPNINIFLEKILKSEKEFYLDNAFEIATMINNEDIFTTLLPLKEKNLAQNLDILLNKSIASIMMNNSKVLEKYKHLLGDQKIVEQINNKYIKKIFLRKILDLYLQEDIVEIKTFFSHFHAQIEPRVLKILKADEISGQTSVILDLFHKNILIPSEDTFFFLCNIIYRYIPDEDKKKILELLTFFPNKNNMNFYLQEFIKNRDKFNFNKKTLTEVVNNHE